MSSTRSVIPLQGNDDGREPSLTAYHPLREHTTMNTPTFKHTPGPWHTSPNIKSHSVCDQYGTTVAVVGNAFGVSHERRLADARLIAAAPDLLASLKALVVIAGTNGVDPWAMRHAQSAIAKAEGL